MKHCTNLLRLLCFCLVLCAVSAFASYQPRFSTAGFYQLPETGRSAYSMNPAWRFLRGKMPGAQSVDFEDKDWKLVSLPHGLELLPYEASGCINYQGEAWYRKHFTPQEEWKGKQLFLHFEAIMGKSKVWVNGQLVKEHFGGFLPVIADITSYLRYGQDNVIAVWTDNSDDPSYPPGKAQDMLDFAYLGGIYRDCWLVAHNRVYITDPNYEEEVAGGGLFVSFGNISDVEAQVRLDAHLRNASSAMFTGKLIYRLCDKEGKLVAMTEKNVKLRSGKAQQLSAEMKVQQPHLWEPDSPYLYDLFVYVKDRNGDTVDGYRRRIGIRSIEFKGKDGFWLNGKPYPFPLIGANRHQDFAVIGNALPNSLHWRDAKKLRDAGLRVIRNAHYPQDPAFMDACDELGLFVIVNTPGWQFWNEEPVFARRVYSDIRNMVRRDRNHPSVWIWEPILNETWYPEDFACNVVNILKEEYPYPYCYAGCDVTAKGHEYFPVHFTHPLNGAGGAFNTDTMDPKISYFTREWGDNVDDWNSHNSPSRVYRGWGEVPMLIQAQGYAKPSYQYTCYDALYRTSRQHVGGCLWHSFDHQRGYHPDPFYGGIMDAFRQPKYSYYMFCSQRPVQENPALIAENGPMVYIAHAMTPFSPKDITVYSNCEEVRLTYCKEGKTFTYRKPADEQGMPSPIITFPGVFDVMDDKALSREAKQADSYLLAEGLVGGKVVATHKVEPARRPSKLVLWVDNEGVDMVADGSDIVTVVAAITDEKGNIKRLNNGMIKFEIEGEGRLVADERTFTNPRAISWGTAPVLVQSTTVPGKIRVRASMCWQGIHTPQSAEIEITTHPASGEWIADQEELNLLHSVQKYRIEHQSVEVDNDNRQKKMRLKEVEKQQSDFE